MCKNHTSVQGLLRHILQNVPTSNFVPTGRYVSKRTILCNRPQMSGMDGQKSEGIFFIFESLKLGPFASMSGAEYFTPPSHEDVPKVIRFSMRH